MVVNSLPPGPKKNILPGFRMVAFNRKPLQFLEQMACEFGDISHIRLNTRQVYFVNHPDFIEKIILNPKYFINRPFPDLGNGLLQSNLPDFECAIEQLYILSQLLNNPQATHRWSPMVTRIIHKITSDWHAGRSLVGFSEMKRLLMEIFSQLASGLNKSETVEHQPTVPEKASEIIASAFLWFLYYVAQNEVVEQKLLSEINRTNFDELLDESCLDVLPYTQQVFSETLRLYPPVWIIHRQVSEDFLLGDYSLPKGASVLISAWVMQHDARFYPNPMSFEPDRWHLSNRASDLIFSYFPFGWPYQVSDPFAYFTQLNRLAGIILAMIARDWRLCLQSSGAIRLRTNGVLQPKPDIYFFLDQR